MNKEVFSFTNGFKVIVEKDIRVPLVAFFLSVNQTGSVNEREYLGSGISHFLEHSIFLGSKKFPQKDQFSNFLEKKGATDFNAYTTFDYTAYYFTFLAKFFEPVLTGFFDFILNPLFPPKEVENERGSILSEMDIGYDNPNDFFYQGRQFFLEKARFKKYPIIGLKKLFKKINAEHIRAFHKKNYNLGNMTLSIVGNINGDKVTEIINSNFKTKLLLDEKLSQNLSGKSTLRQKTISIFNKDLVSQLAKSAAKPEKKNKQSYVYRFFHKSTVYPKFVMLYPAPNLFSDEKITMEMFCYLLGQGKGSILNQEVKDKYNFVVSIFSDYSYDEERGFLKVFFNLKNNPDPIKLKKNFDLVVDKIREILDNISIYITEEKLKGVKESIFLSGLEERQSYLNIAYNNLRGLLDFNNPYYEENYYEKIKPLNLEKIIKSINGYFADRAFDLGVLLNDDWRNQDFLSNFSKSRTIATQGELEKKLEKLVALDLKVKPKKVKITLPEDSPYYSHQSSRQEKSKRLSANKVEKSLLNNIPCIRVFMPKQERFFFSMHIAGGQKLDGISLLKDKKEKKKWGIGSAYLFSKMLFTSNGVYSKDKLNDLIRTNALGLFSKVKDNSIHLGFSCLASKVEIALDVLQSLLLNNSFRKADFELEKKSQLFSINQLYENSENIAFIEFKKKLLPGSVFGYPVLGDRSITKKIGFDDMNYLLSKVRSSVQSIVVTDGNNKQKNAEQLGNSLGNLALNLSSKKNYPSKKAFKKLSFRGREDIHFSYNKNILQSHVHLGFHAPERFSKDEVIFKMIESYLTGLGGPLFKLRSEGYVKNGKRYPGRAYSLGAFYASAESYGMMVFYASLGSEHKAEYPWAIEAFQNEIGKIKLKGIAEKELARVKNSFLVNHYKQSLRPSFSNGMYAFYEANGREYKEWDAYISLIKNVTNEQIIEALSRYFSSDNFLVHVMISK